MTMQLIDFVCQNKRRKCGLLPISLPVGIVVSRKHYQRLLVTIFTKTTFKAFAACLFMSCSSTIFAVDRFVKSFPAKKISNDFFVGCTLW